jgi:lipid II:glycine glycyltransferase (peptidoglycan interpeptide bridge formation enzyme)
LRLPASRAPVIYHPFETLLFDLTQSADHLFGEINATGRNLVRRAERHRDRIDVCRNDAAAYRDFIGIYNSFVAVKKYTEKISEKRLDALKPNTDVLVAYFDGRPVCGHVLVRDEGLRRIGVLWSTSTRFNVDDVRIISSVNRWLHWYEMLLYRSEGMRIYDFAGIGTETPEKATIANFKLSFGGTRVVEHDYIITRAAGRAAIQLLFRLRRIRAARAFRFSFKTRTAPRPSTTY